MDKKKPNAISLIKIDFKIDLYIDKSFEVKQ